MAKGSSVLLITCVFLAICAGTVGSAHGQAAREAGPPGEEATARTGFPSPFEGIKKTYSEIRTLEARFHQRITIASLKKERESDGEFLYKRNRGFVWKYRTPKAKTFLYDGKYVWQADEDKPFVIRTKIRKDKTGGTFLDLVEDITKMDELFTLKQQSRSGDFNVLELVPKKEGSITAAKLWVDRHDKVRKIEILEFTGNTNSIEFSSIRTNQAIDDGKFVFKPEKGVEIIER